MIKTNKVAKIIGVAVLAIALMVGASTVSFADGDKGGISIDLTFSQMKELIRIFVPQPVEEFSLGAVSTLDGVDNPYTSIGGLREYNAFRSMVATSSVVCSIQNPFNSTTTIERFTAQATANGFGAERVYLSTSTTNAATSTIALSGGHLVGSTDQFSFVWEGNSATSSLLTIEGGTSDINVLPGLTPDLVSNYILGPGEFLNLAIGTSTPGTYDTYYTGTCTAQLRKL